jgi:hypothetical protein
MRGHSRSHCNAAAVPSPTRSQEVFQREVSQSCTAAHTPQKHSQTASRMLGDSPLATVRAESSHILTKKERNKTKMTVPSKRRGRELIDMKEEDEDEEDFFNSIEEYQSYTVLKAVAAHFVKDATERRFLSITQTEVDQRTIQRGSALLFSFQQVLTWPASSTF